MGLKCREPHSAAAYNDSGDESAGLVEDGAIGDAAGRHGRAAAAGRPTTRTVLVLLGVCAAVGLVWNGLSREYADSNTLRAVTWNIAAINNNPFEYWITHDDAAYNALMEDVQSFISEPGARDVRVDAVFTPAMWDELKALMLARGWTGVDRVEAIWRSDLAGLPIVRGFMKNKTLGDKRLASMPDRITNTVNLASGGVANRPTVINCFPGDLGTTDAWWKAWKSFMFVQSLDLPNGLAVPASLLGKIKHSKYPAISQAEEEISVPLQTLAAAIFDAVLVHLVNSVSPDGAWQPLRQQMCDALNRKKDERTLAILSARSYAAANVVFLQETAAVFVRKVQASELAARFHVVKAGGLDGKRDQNSLMLLAKPYWRVASIREHTAAVMGGFDRKVPVANGDLLVVSAEDLVGRKYLLASFHGDTDGLATLPVLAAVDALAKTMPDHRLVFGLDANTHTVPVPNKKQGVAEFGRAFLSKGYSSCWGDVPDPANPTTFNARTFLQPQLQKAARADEKVTKGDKNPKDFILFARDKFVLQATTKDNTGDRRYVEDMVFPTLRFPSDHGLVATTLAVLA